MHGMFSPPVPQADQSCTQIERILVLCTAEVPQSGVMTLVSLIFAMTKVFDEALFLVDY